ncbi:MAG: hypothetical protein AAFS10_16305, partial [Myxococcota bacterium]
HMRLGFVHPPSMSSVDGTGLHMASWSHVAIYMAANAALLTLAAGAMVSVLGAMNPNGPLEAWWVWMLAVMGLSGVIPGLVAWATVFMDKLPVLPRWRPMRVEAPRAAGELVWDGSVWHTGDARRGVDLNQPFQAHLSREPEQGDGDTVWVCLDLRQQCAERTGQIRLAACLPRSAMLEQLPMLRTDAPVVSRALFLEQLWPEVQRKANMHGVSIHGAKPVEQTRHTAEDVDEVVAVPEWVTGARW